MRVPFSTQQAWAPVLRRCPRGRLVWGLRPNPPAGRRESPPDRSALTLTGFGKLRRGSRRRVGRGWATGRRHIRGAGDPLGTGVLSPRGKSISVELDRSAGYASVCLCGYHCWCSEGAAPTVSNEPSLRPGGPGWGGLTTRQRLGPGGAEGGRDRPLLRPGSRAPLAGTT